VGKVSVANPFKPKLETSAPDAVNEPNPDFEHRQKYHAAIAQAID